MNLGASTQILVAVLEVVSTTLSFLETFRRHHDRPGQSGGPGSERAGDEPFDETSVTGTPEALVSRKVAVR
ncbi:hypothetical protein OG417_32915 [Actinoallomurus sp. NBC_01490]|uniref:hypothetical protein n=1 Tax=Actinoallomurus sp. NBC_01490 TaxID=2903557 RepID=UPI002E3443E8|nr:hypothetical protein [Actinoallomurus sp. NBC_01490]